MPGHRFFVDYGFSRAPAVGELVSLTSADSHHARDVLRLSVGDVVTLISKETGIAAEAALLSLTPDVRLVIRTLTDAAPHSSRVASLLFALCKGERNDLVVEKATELGVGSIHLFQAARSVVRLDAAKDVEKKLSRWRKIAEGAAKQCGRNSVPQITVSRSTAAAVSEVSANAADRRFFCSLTAGSMELRAVARPAGFIHLSIGPEGDFTAEEEQLLLEHQFEPISLGPTVLRSETAAIAAISICLGLWGYEPDSSN